MLVSRASAEISFQAVPDLFGAGVRIALQDLRGRHDHARRAIAALQAVMLPESLLDGMQFAVLGQALDSGDRRAIGLCRQHGARFYRLAIDQHSAGPAQRGFTTYV